MTAADVLYMECIHCPRPASPTEDWCCFPCNAGDKHHTQACDRRAEAKRREDASSAP